MGPQRINKVWGTTAETPKEGSRRPGIKADAARRIPGRFPGELVGTLGGRAQRPTSWDLRELTGERPTVGTQVGGSARPQMEAEAAKRTAGRSQGVWRQPRDAIR